MELKEEIENLKQLNMFNMEKKDEILTQLGDENIRLKNSLKRKEYETKGIRGHIKGK